MSDHSSDPSGSGAPAPLWHGRFADGPSADLWDFTVSLSFDRRLAPYDIRGCRAHAEGLAAAGLLGDDELAAVLDALDVTGRELAENAFEFMASDEDIHTAIERRVTALAGPAGAKLHTGRSRNDQVATAFRLWSRDALVSVAEAIMALQDVLIERASQAGDAYMPGLTHLQAAQPVLLAHQLLAHHWALARDLDRIVDAHRRTDVSPLGAGALAGSSLPLDPPATAARLGFGAVFDNSLDAVSDRDFVAEALFVVALAGIHLSRIGEEIVLWSTDDVGFVTLDDAYATGSSMLPQKKNPDIAELTRGKSGRLIGNLTGLLATLKGLPLAYNRDLQEDKEPLFDSVDQVRRALVAVAGMLATATFHLDKMAAAADRPGLGATDLAEHLVLSGVPFRDAHAIVGDLVRRSIGPDSPPLRDLVAADGRLGHTGAQLLGSGVAAARRTTWGGGGPAPVAAQLERARGRLAADRSRVAELSR